MLPRQPHVRDSDGIVLSGAFIIKYRSEPASSMTLVDLEIMQMHCYVCGRGGIGSAHSGTVLAPADLSFKMSRGKSHDGGIKMEGSVIAAQALEVYISYQDCKLAVEILQGLRAASLETSSSTRSALGSNAGAAALEEASVMPLSSPHPAAAASDAWTSRSKAGGALAPTPSVPEGPHAQLSTAVQVEGIRIVLLNDFNGRSVPLVSTNLQPLEVLGSGRPSSFVVECEMGVQVRKRSARTIRGAARCRRGRLYPTECCHRRLLADVDCVGWAPCARAGRAVQCERVPVGALCRGVPLPGGSPPASPVTGSGCLWRLFWLPPMAPCCLSWPLGASDCI